MAYKIEIIQTKKAVIGAATSNEFEALDFAHRFIRNLDNINQLDFKSTKYEVGDAIECTVKEVKPGVVELVEESTTVKREFPEPSKRLDRMQRQLRNNLGPREKAMQNELKNVL